MKTISNFFFHRNPAETVPELPETEKGTLEIIEVAIEKVVPNPFQPRKNFSDEGLAELSASIREFGVLQPLLVRPAGSGFELIAGERRLRASALADRGMVPCIVREAGNREMAEIAMIENLQREDLHYFEEAAGYENLLTQFDLTQEVLAARVGKSQSTIANKMRLLKLAPEIREYIFREKLTERHCRALLKVDDEPDQMAVLHIVVEKKLNVRETEALIEEQLRASANPAHVRRTNMLKIIKDVRIFINTIGELVSQMRKVGLDVQLTQKQDDDFVTITMVVPKRK